MTTGNYEPATWIPYLELFVPFVQAIAWPIAGVCVAWLYKDEIGKLIPRIRKVGPSGFELTDTGQQKDGSVGAKRPSELRDIKGRERTAAIAYIEKSIHTDLENKDAEEGLDFVVWGLAQARLDSHFWRVYNYIFGSQITLLRLLKTHNGELDNKTLSEVVSNTLNANQNFGNWQQEDYLRFLKDHQLVDDTSTGLQISAVGDDFLLFLHRFSLSDNRTN